MHSLTNNIELSVCNNGVPKNRGAEVVWRNLSVYAKAVRGGRGADSMKNIITNASGCIKPGTLMAVMGARYTMKFKACISTARHTPLRPSNDRPVCKIAKIGLLNLTGSISV